MPRLRRKRADAFDFSERTRAHLETGVDWDFLDGDELSEEELREAWEELRCEIVEDYIQEHPGERPWAWWKFDRGMDAPLQIYDKPGETAYLAAHGLLSEREQKEWARRQARLEQKGFPLSLSIHKRGHDD